MTDKKDQLSIFIDDYGTPSILVDTGRCDAVIAVLNKNGWSHSIDYDVITSEGVSMSSVIYLRKEVNLEAVQAALDSIE